VPSERGNLVHLWQTPETNLIQGVAVGGDHFIARLGEHEIADLGPGVDAFSLTELMGVPKADGPVGSAAAGREYVVLVRRPGQRFNLSLY